MNRVILRGTLQNWDLRFLPNLHPVLSLQLLVSSGTPEKTPLLTQVEVSGKNTENISAQLEHDKVLLIEGALVHKSWTEHSTPHEKLLVRTQQLHLLTGIKTTFESVDEETFVLTHPPTINEVDLIGILHGPPKDHANVLLVTVAINERFRSSTDQHTATHWVDVQIPKDHIQNPQVLKQGMKIHLRGSLGKFGPKHKLGIMCTSIDLLESPTTNRLLKSKD